MAKKEEFTVDEVVNAFMDMSFDDQILLVERLNDALEEVKNIKRQELVDQLEKLGGWSAPSGRKSRSTAGTGERKRESPKPLYRAPNGFEWSGRGAMPKVFKEMGITDKADLEKYRIKD